MLLSDGNRRRLMPFRLVVERDDRVQRFLLAEGDNLIGSGSECAVRIGHPTVSRRQAVLRVAGERLELEDLGSRNGTSLAGEMITSPVPVAVGRPLRLGGVPARIERVAAAELEAAVEPAGAHQVAAVPSTSAAAPRRGATLTDAPGELFVREHLGPLLQRVAAGGAPSGVAQAVGTALAEVVRATAVEIEVEAGDGTGVLFRLDGARVADGGPPALSRRTGEVRVSVAAVGLAPTQAEPLLEAAALLVALAREHRHPHPAVVTTPCAMPEPATVEPAVRALYAEAARVAAGDVSVLIRGESGTGKEVLARYVHAASARAAAPFETLNCAALPRELLEAELFGIERGVATGVDERPGRFEAAHGGTLFLDEIGDMSPETQATILRVLQERLVYRVGARRPRPADVRIVAATNRDLERMLADGGFRSDLYHRIADWTVRLPPLRERPGDIPNLAAWFLERESARRGVRGRGISRAALDVLLDHDWPGNIRQLEREMARAALFLDDGDVLETRHLSGTVRATVVHDRSGGLRAALEAAERREILRALTTCDGDVAAAAGCLGIGRSTLYRRLGELDISPR